MNGIVRILGLGILLTLLMTAMTYANVIQYGFGYSATANYEETHGFTETFDLMPFDSTLGHLDSVFIDCNQYFYFSSYIITDSLDPVSENSFIFANGPVTAYGATFYNIDIFSDYGNLYLGQGDSFVSAGGMQVYTDPVDVSYFISPNKIQLNIGAYISAPVNSYDFYMLSEYSYHYTLVPEPSTFLLLGAGLGGLALLRRNARKQ